MMTGPIFYVTLIIGVIVFIALISAVINMLKKAKQGEALIRTGLGGTRVSFNAILVTPVIHHLERLDITMKTYEVSYRKDSALLTRDGRKLEIDIIFYLRVNMTEQDVKLVAQAFGGEDVSSPEFIERNFGKKFKETILTLIYRSNFEDLIEKVDSLKMEIIETIGIDLNGFVLDDLAIHHLKELKESLITEP